MYFYQVKIADSSKNESEYEEAIVKVIQQVMDTTRIKTAEQLKQLLHSELMSQVFVAETDVLIMSVDSMWRADTPQKKSYFIAMIINNKKPLMFFAKFQDLETLKQRAALEISKFFANKPEQLRIHLKSDLPTVLFAEIEKYFQV